MRLQDIEIQKLEIPFRVAFRHASAARAQTEGVLVAATSDCGQRGWGEGCPRSYVTSETVESVFRFFERHQRSWLSLTSLDDLRIWMGDHGGDIDKNPAAWCAVELALLDLLGRQAGQSVEAILSLPELSGEFHYTAVLGINSLAGFKAQLEKYVALGFRDFKIKVSGNLDEDRERMVLIRSRGISGASVRLDANNLWQTAKEAMEYIQRLDFPVRAVEEPLSSGDYEGLQALHEVLGIPIILDESFQRYEQFDPLSQSPNAWIINLRISKMGGLLRSLSIAQRAEDLKIPVIIGAQVGETSLLSRAALTVAQACRRNLIGQEGAFGLHLLERDVTADPIMFSPGGLWSPQAPPGPGWGIDVSHP